MQAIVDIAERELKNREARTLPLPAGAAIGVGCFLALFVAGMGAGMLQLARQEGGAMYAILVIPIAGLAITLGLVGYGVRGLLRRMWAGKRAALHPGEPWYADWHWDPDGAVAKRARLRFGTFPFFLGRSLQGRVTAKALAGRDDVVVTLRCLDERYVTQRTHSSSAGQLCVGVFQLHEALGTLKVDGNGDASVSLPLPDADLETLLNRELPRYWQLELEANGTEPIRFLVPVYRSAR